MERDEARAAMRQFDAAAAGAEHLLAFVEYLVGHDVPTEILTSANHLMHFMEGRIHRLARIMASAERAGVMTAAGPALDEEVSS